MFFALNVTLCFSYSYALLAIAGDPHRAYTAVIILLIPDVAEDLLDDIATDALRCQVEADFGTAKRKVHNYISTSYDRFRGKLESKIKEVIKTMNSLALQITTMGLKEVHEGRSSQSGSTSSLVDPETIIYGRDDDEKAI
ncbi:putative disease resistance rpp13-like protein 1, partial [Quercus suber]